MLGPSCGCRHPINEAGPGWIIASGAGLVALSFIALTPTAPLLPESRLDCTDPEERETSLDRGWTLTLCRRSDWFAMPGGSGDAPGWIVLRDNQSIIGGVVDLSMAQSYRVASSTTQWEMNRVRGPLVAELPLAPASEPVTRWVDARVWRWRARLGLVPPDAVFR